MWRLDRQTDTRKAAVTDISESTYAKVTYFYRLLLVVTLGIPVMPRVNRDLKLIQMCIFCKQHKSKHSSVQIAEVLTSDNRIRVPPPGSHIQITGPKSKIVPSNSAQTR